jgi:DNA-directed RNA polymerase subunit RPC12/RpoP
MTSKEAFKDIYNRNEALKKEKHFHIGEKVMNIMKELVERDTPMKVIKTQNWSYHCPKCKDEIEVNDVDFDSKQVYRYCYYCGQKLDWGE